jgi:hypothetical protein
MQVKNCAALVAVAASLIIAGPASADVTKTFSNPTPITFNDASYLGSKTPATPDASTIHVPEFSFVSGPTPPYIVSITLHGVSHTSAADMYVQLTGPAGTSLLLNHVGGQQPVSGAELRFTTFGGKRIPSGPLVSGTYWLSTLDSAGFEVTSPVAYRGRGRVGTVSGDITLRAFDDEPLDVGTIAGGWTVEFAGKLRNRARFSEKTKLDRRKGTARLTVTVPNPGVLELLKKPGVRGVKLSVATPGVYTLTVKARGKAAKQLKSTGKVSVPARIKYTPMGGTPKTLSKTVGLKRHK